MRAKIQEPQNSPVGCCCPFSCLECFVDRSVQKRFLVKSVVAAAAAMVGLVTQGNAAGLTPGQWRSDYRVFVNGKESTAALTQFAAQVRSSMPVELNNKWTAVSSLGTYAYTTACFKPEVASKLTSPRLVFNMFAKMNPRCTLYSGPATATSVTFTGRCNDPFSYTGNVSGQVNVPSSSSWNVTIEGVGRFPDAVLTALRVPARSLVSMKTTATSFVRSPSCE